MKKTLLLILLLFTFSLVSCQNNHSNDIITTLYPSYDIAKNIVKDNLSVKLLVKPGSEVHDYMPSSYEMSQIRHSKLFIFTSYEMDLWLNNNEKKILGQNTLSLNLSLGFDLELEDHDHDDHDDHEHHHDLHFWTDPIVYIELIEYVLESIIAIDPINESFYVNNANNYINEIFLIHNEINNYLNTINKKNIYFSGHNAMQYFSSRYDLKIIALSNTDKPDADFSLKQIITLLEEIKTNNVNYIFIEELKDPKVALTIQKELKRDNYDIELLELHGYHNLTKQDFNNNVSYLDLLNNNFTNIKKALGN